MKEPHTHIHTKLGLHRILQVQPKYRGATGDKAYLYRECECGHKKAFEYGDYNKMKELLSALEEKKA